MKKLVAIFKTSGGRSQTWSYQNPAQDRSSDEIRGILERLTLLTIFEKDGEKLFDHVVAAKYVETVETIIF
ncbi:DUF2922 family protein [Enterococcus hulanensis]|uniref:DUF2922 family protein n=1 Tax=Enterococcus TaxID=1350 RepID=UPI000B5A86E0|nr:MULTISPECIES: DUF2922 family protein [Enterococcus]MBO0409583.1 DUF2922 family protein [Enterococcus hulanensis]MBO0456632.1 DUF2922 family protein [Enterococcus hulanensis]OTO21049.1 hypothetical protein A5875_002421 [Enterococcus sp. 3H8_DIV0648]